MANIQDRDVDVRQRNELNERPNDRPHPNLEGARPNDQPARESYSISVLLLRIFIWTCMLMVAATNFLTASIYKDQSRIRICSLTLANSNYGFTAMMTLLFVVGFYEYFLVGCLLKHEMPKTESCPLMKFSFVAPVVSFLILSDYYETKYNCRPARNPGYIATQLFTASSTILVVFTSLYTLSNLYKYWVVSQKKHEENPYHTSILQVAFDECLKAACTPDGINKFKAFASDFKELKPSFPAVRHLVLAYSLVYIKRDLRPQDFARHGQLRCGICHERFRVLERALGAEKEKEFLICHQDCLISKLHTGEDYFMPLERCVGLLDQIISSDEFSFDLSMLKSI